MKEKEAVGISTTDIYIASALMTRGFKEIVNQIGDNKFEFLFTDEVKDIVSAYWRHELFVDAFAMAQNISNLRSQMRNFANR